MKKIFITILMLLMVTGCKKDDNTITMVTEAGFAPYEYYEDGEIVGVDIEVAKEIANYLGKELIVKDTAFDSLINELNSGKADFAAAGMSITPERLKEADFSIEYTTSRQVVLVRTDSNITSVKNIYDKKVGVQLGSVADLHFSDKYPDTELVRQKKYLSLVEDLKAKKIDLIVMDYLPAMQIVKNKNNLKILEGYVFEDSYGIAVKKGNTELLNQINEVLTKLINENKIEDYIIKYSD